MTLRLAACRGCGCPTSPGPRCGDCRLAWQRQYNENRPEHHDLYQTADWRHLSRVTRDRADRCHWCLVPLTGRSVADHVIPIDQRPDLALEPSNVVASCVGCNTRRGRNARKSA